jgi:hypothetical protein
VSLAHIVSNSLLNKFFAFPNKVLNHLCIGLSSSCVGIGVFCHSSLLHQGDVTLMFKPMIVGGL